MLGRVVGVVGASAGLTSDNGDAAVGLAARHGGSKVEVEKFVVKRTAAGNVGGRCRAYGEGFERVYPVEGELGLKDGGVGAFLGALCCRPMLNRLGRTGGVGGCLLYTYPSPRD